MTKLDNKQDILGNAYHHVHEEEFEATKKLYIGDKAIFAVKDLEKNNNNKGEIESFRVNFCLCWFMSESI